mmetsp:Transcript_15493/g.45743  ORF Transcript_15493/g.45743 Transcript_15493/m.45743 type:complete len:88 (-) Transcript_15493:1240-1503(-)
MSFALRAFGRQARDTGRSILRDRVPTQQKRLMSGGEDDGVHRVNWWDAPTNPDVWQKHQLAYWTMAAYGSVYWMVAGGKKKEQPKKE